MNTNTTTTKANMLPLIINETQLDKYNLLSSIDLTTIPDEIRIVYELSLMSLNSKQCNEPYEQLLSKLLNVVPNTNKHGWDAYDNIDNPTEYYEFKPSSRTKNPTATINDDTLDKISKYEVAYLTNKKSWIVLAGINRDIHSFDCIYKFPAHIFTQSRKEYLLNLFEKNKHKEKQTRATYSISVKKGIDLCKQFNETYYVWKRS